MKTLRIFVSSPGDVGSERVLTGRVLKQLQGEFSRRVLLEPYFWEHEPMRATTDFQGNIPTPAEFDIVICILWSRLGSPLNEKYRRKDGSPYASGTEYELDSADEARRRTGKPELFVYRSLQEPIVPMRPEEARTEKIRQFDALQNFLKRWFLNVDGSVRIATNDYRDLAEFEEKLKSNLHDLIETLTPAQPGPQADTVRQGSYAKGSPFRKLRPFEFEDSEIFFGRTKATSEVLNALRDKAASGVAFTLLFGGSGSGKSSVARAGVLPLVVTPGIIDGIGLWRWAIMRPGESAGNIFSTLATALMSDSALPELASDAGASVADLATALENAPGGVPLLIKSSLTQAGRDVQTRERLPKPPAARLVLLVDQFEEIFTLTDQFSPEIRSKFVQALGELARSGAVWVLTTLRSEFFARCDEIPELVALKSGQGQVQLLAPSESELRQIVRLPAIVAGLQFETDANGNWLADVLVDAGGRQAGSLPLLEFALEELYLRRRDDLWLTFEAFEKLGGIEGSVESAAEAVFAKLSPEAQSQFDSVFRALVTIDLNDETAFVRRIALLGQLATTEERKSLIDAFVDARLLVTGSDAAKQGTVQVAHEALFRHWKRLKELLEVNRQFLNLRARAGAALALWNAQGREKSYLWTQGKLLAEAEELLGRSEDLTSAEAEFARESVTAGKAARRTRRILIGVGALIAVAAGVSGYLWWQNYERERAVEKWRVQLATVLRGVKPNPYEVAEISRQLLAKKPDDSATWAVYAAALLEQGEYENFENALRDWQQQVVPAPPKIADLRGDRETKQGRPAKAIEYWSQYLADPKLTAEERKQTWKKLAVAHATLGQWLDARDRLTDWIKLEDNALARVRRAKANQARRDCDAAREDLEAARKMDPGNPEVKNFGPLVDCGAVEKLNERVRKSPNDPSAWLARAMAWAREQQFALALEDLERARNSDPDSVRVWLEQAHLSWQLEQPIPKESGIRVSAKWKRAGDPGYAMAFAGAEREMEKLGTLDAACAQQPGEARPYLERAAFLHLIGQPALAIRDFTRALEIDDRLIEALQGRAESYRAVDQPEAAEADLRRIQSTPNQPDPTP